jgi:hypothetical protein
MRKGLVGFTCAAVVLTVSAVVAQTPRPSATSYSGIKLVNMKAQTPEQTVTLRFDAEELRILDPMGGAGKSLRYTGLTATHTFASAPPAAAGDPSAAPTGAATFPMYMGKPQRNWLTLSSEGTHTVLRVSDKVYTQLKASLAEHRIPLEEGR